MVNLNVFAVHNLLQGKPRPNILGTLLEDEKESNAHIYHDNIKGEGM